ncbi:hypothetical protein ACJX0J_026090, partial [Zea mays]
SKPSTLRPCFCSLASFSRAPRVRSICFWWRRLGGRRLAAAAVHSPLFWGPSPATSTHQYINANQWIFGHLILK